MPVSAALINMTSRKIFHFSKARFSLQARTFFLAEEKKIQKVDGSAHRANIGAEEPADDKRSPDQ